MDRDGFDWGTARVAALINAGAGKDDNAQTRALIDRAVAPRCAALDWHEIAQGTSPLEAARRAAEAGYDLILAIGGDGTQAAVAQALAGGATRMAPLPGGTFNFFARDLGFAPEMEEAVAALLTTARPRTIDLAEVNGTVFLNNASFGLYPDILERRESLYKRWGRSRFGAYWTVLTSLANLRRAMRLSVQHKGAPRQFRTRLAFVAASPLQLETHRLDGAQALREGHLALFVARGNTPWSLVGAALRLALGKASRQSDFDLIEADDLTIDTRPPERMIAHDGEKSRMTGPFRLRVRPQALNVLAPLTRPDGSAARGLPETSTKDPT